MTLAVEVSIIKIFIFDNILNGILYTKMISERSGEVGSCWL